MVGLDEVPWLPNFGVSACSNGPLFLFNIREEFLDFLVLHRVLDGANHHTGLITLTHNQLRRGDTHCFAKFFIDGLVDVYSFRCDTDLKYDMVSLGK